jgi:hypothetical protein
MRRSNKKVKSPRRSSHKRRSKRSSNKHRSARKVRSSHKRRSTGVSGTERSSWTRQAGPPYDEERLRPARSGRRKNMKGGDLNLFKSLITNPLSKSSNLISNLKDHNVLVDRFDKMNSELTKLTKRVEQLEIALAKLKK